MPAWVDPELRFWKNVLRLPDDGCWLWMGKIMKPQWGGYGSFFVGGKRNGGKRTFVRVHRYSYELAKDTIPAGLTIDHLCRVRRCVNPDHLEAVTHRENCIRGTSPSARCAAKTECLNGHPFDAENTWIWSRTGARKCRTCERAKGVRRAAAKKEARRHVKLRRLANSIAAICDLGNVC